MEQAVKINSSKLLKHNTKVKIESTRPCGVNNLEENA